MIEGSVFIPGSGNSVTFPAAGLQVVGIKVSLSTSGYFSTPIDATRNAVFPSKNNSLTLYPVNFTLKGQTLNYSLGSTPYVTIYYGTGSPFGPPRPLDAYAAAVATWAPSAAGSTTLTLNFPSAVKLTGIFTAANITTNYSFTTKPGFTFSDYIDSSDAGIRTDIMPLADIPAANSVPISVTAGAAGNFLIVIYYKQA